MIQRVHPTTNCTDSGRTFDKISRPFLVQPTNQPTNLSANQEQGNCLSLMRAPTEIPQLISLVCKTELGPHQQEQSRRLSWFSLRGRWRPSCVTEQARDVKDTKIRREVKLPLVSEDRTVHTENWGECTKKKPPKKPTQESSPGPVLL